MRKHFGCPVQATANVFAGKWKVLIVWHLAFGTRRSAELRSLLPGITQKVFTTQLRDLERDGVLTRKTSGGAPQRVDYTLTEAGEALITVMESMCSWGTKYLGVPPSLPLLKTETTAHPASDR